MRVFQRYAMLVSRLREAVLESSGVADQATRTGIEAYAAGTGGRAVSADDDVHPDLRDYVDKVSRCAYRITDDDVLALRRAGYSEDEIFEVTASAALGAGLGRLERAYAALKGEV